MSNVLPWWKTAVIYHVYPRSFLDTNGDGIGDLRGVIAGLGHIRSLGANAIWMGPVFRSPQADNGYDVSDYYTVDPIFGTNEDLYDLIEEAHEQGIRVILDLVLNHTSDQHLWFGESRRSRRNAYSDYYIWKDAAPHGGPPNDWGAAFGGSAWNYVPERDQYYLGLFSPAQPDLNWESESVRREISSILKFWMSRNVDGFRLDVINHISKHPDFPSLNGGAPEGVFIDGPRMHEYLRRIRETTGNYSAVGFSDETEPVFLVGEAPGVTPEIAREYVDPDNNELDSLIIFDHLSVDHGPGGKWEPKEWTPDELSRVVDTWQNTLAEPRWPTLYMSNHDQPRVVSRYGDDKHLRRESATALAIYFYLQRGTPIVYQGDEIGMRNYPICSENDLNDVESRDALKQLRGRYPDCPDEVWKRIRRVARDNSRTPFQWADKPNAGFCDVAVAPWYHPNPDFHDWNLEAQKNDPASVFNIYRSVLKLKQSEPFVSGQYRTVAVDEKSIVYERKTDTRVSIVAVNLSGDRTHATVSDARGGTVVFSNYSHSNDSQELSSGTLRLRPYEAVVVRAR